MKHYVKEQVVFTVFADHSNKTEFNLYCGHLKAIQWGFRKQNDSRFIMTYDETHPTLAKEFEIRETPLVVATDYRDGKVTRYYLHDAVPRQKTDFIELIESIWNRTVPDKYLLPQEPPKYSITRPKIQLALLIAILLTIIIPCCLCTFLNISRKEKQD